MVPVSWHVHVRWHNCGLHPFYEGLFVKPYFGVRGFGLLFTIFSSHPNSAMRSIAEPRMTCSWIWPRAQYCQWSLVVWFCGTWDLFGPVYHLLSVPQAGSGHLILHALSAQWNQEGRCPILITVCVSHPGM